MARCERTCGYRPTGKLATGQLVRMDAAGRISPALATVWPVGQLASARPSPCASSIFIPIAAARLPSARCRFDLLFAYVLGSNARLAENPDDKLLPSVARFVETFSSYAFEEDRRSGEVLWWLDTLRA